MVSLGRRESSSALSASDADAVVKIPGGPTETTEADWSQDDVV